jgi:ABC-type Fe3+ transport system substrate-binding protein
VYGRWVIAQTYVVGGRIGNSGALTQLRYGWSALWKPVASGAVALASPCTSSCDEAAAAIESFWAQHGESLAAAVPMWLPQNSEISL